MRDIAIFGAGGFGREFACIIKRINAASADGPVWNFIGYFDDNPEIKGQQITYGPVLGTIEDLNAWPTPLSLAIAIGSPQSVKAVQEKIANHSVDFPNLIDPHVTIMDPDLLTLGRGNVFACGCTISIGANIGDFNTFNNNVVIGHDDVIGSFNSFMPNVNLGGSVTVGECNFFAVKSTVLQCLKVGNNVKVGANSVMMRNASDNNLYLGIPARKVKF